MSEVQNTPVLNLADALALANEAAAVATVDMSEVSKGGGGEKRVLPEGFAFARLIEYVELGEHIVEFDGKPKPPAMQFRLGFALWGDTNPTATEPAADRPDDLFHYIDKDGNVKPGIFRTFDMSLGNNEKAKVKLAFDKMNWQRKAGVKSFGQFLGQGFLLPIKRSKITKGKNAGKFRNDIDWANIMKPMDPISHQPYPIPETPMELVRYFFWDRPTQATWDALQIGDGTLTEDGKSRDFIRDMMKKAVNFEGSALHQMLGGGAALTLPPVTNVAQAPASTPAVPSVPAVPSTPAVPAVPSVPVTPAVPADVPFEGGSIPAVPTVPTVPVV